MTDIKSEFTEIRFLAEKVHAHYWPLDTPKWNNITNKQVNENLNNNKEKKQIVIKSNVIFIDNYEFTSLKKIGLTIPLFKKQYTLVFEGSFDKFYAHVHVTTSEKNYLEIFNKLMHWRSRYFPDCLSS